MKRRFIAAIVLLACTGCATLEPRLAEAPDRFERVNRAVYKVNRGIDRRIVLPIARGYDRVMPDRVERRTRNFFTNLRAPIDIANNWLQGKFKPGFADLGRFLLNSTVGIGGFFDPAKRVGLERHPEDFGQTLAVWGVPSGPYVVVPLLGPRSLRDAGGVVVDLRGDLLVESGDSARDGVLVWRFVSDRAALLPAERVLESAFDEYALVREAYRQKRTHDVLDGAEDDDSYLYLEPEE